MSRFDTKCGRAIHNKRWETGIVDVEGSWSMLRQARRESSSSRIRGRLKQSILSMR